MFVSLSVDWNALSRSVAPQLSRLAPDTALLDALERVFFACRYSLREDAFASWYGKLARKMSAVNRHKGCKFMCIGLSCSRFNGPSRGMFLALCGGENIMKGVKEEEFCREQSFLEGALRQRVLLEECPHRFACVDVLGRFA